MCSLSLLYLFHYAIVNPSSYLSIFGFGLEFADYMHGHDLRLQCLRVPLCVSVSVCLSWCVCVCFYENGIGNGVRIRYCACIVLLFILFSFQLQLPFQLLLHLGGSWVFGLVLG